MQKLSNIRRFVRAATEKQLEDEMLKRNIRDGKVNNYFDIQQDSSGWIAWYMGEKNLTQKEKNEMFSMMVDSIKAE